MDLVYHSMAMPTEGPEDLHLTVYNTEPGTPSADALALLASWSATDAERGSDTAAAAQA